MSKPKILIFASGSAEGGGTGFENLAHASRDGRLSAEIVAVVSNHAQGGVRTRADKLKIQFVHFPKTWTAEAYQQIASESGADFFVLSGWLKLVKGLLADTRFNSRTVINIHPAPLPEFGGQGLYGHNIHKAVIAAYKRGEIRHSAVSMHFVTEEYDKGPVFFRYLVPIYDGDTADSLGERVTREEHVHQPRITNMVVNGLISWNGTEPDSLEVPSGYLIEQYAART